MSDPGLLSALPRCPTLAHLELNQCWLASAAGLQAAAAAALQTGGHLAEVLLDGTAVPLPVPSAKAASGMRVSRRHISGGSGMPYTDLQPALRLAGSPARTSPQAPWSAPRGGTVLPAHVLAHDERLVYTREELLSLAPGRAAGQRTAGTAEQQLRQGLPPDLRYPSE